jgi:uncharacterized protein (TIGR02145 family)
LNEWHHLAFSYSSINGMAKIYIDGQNVAEFEGVDTLTPTNHPLHIGGNPLVPAYNSVDGSMDDVGFWERTLELSEITAIYNAQLPVLGCTDSIACNFNEEANNEDDSCVYPLFGEDCETGGAACGEGTIWDVNIQACVVSDFCQEDLDGDGVIGISDLMQLLSFFGTVCPIWICGDPIAYHGYNYATVQIGEQCWFAENLRNEYYANGDAIPGDLANAEWITTSEGAQAVYIGVFGSSDYDPAMLADYGRLYNWYAVDDTRGLCPIGWHVPADGEFMTLEMELGMSESEANEGGYRGTDQGAQMKSSPEDSPFWNGTNTSGFSGLAGGYRNLNGDCMFESSSGYFWSASPNETYGWFRGLYFWTTEVSRNSNDKRYGLSARCIKD